MAFIETIAEDEARGPVADMYERDRANSGYIALTAAMRCFFSKTLDAVGARPDAQLAELDPEVRDALTVGRPIADP